MKIALIIENSQAAKNGIIHEALTEVVGPLGHQVFNYGMYTPEDAASLTYVMNGLLAGILLNSKAADFVITGCGTGMGSMLACNAMQGVFCGLVVDPTDAFLFGQINDEPGRFELPVSADDELEDEAEETAVRRPPRASAPARRARETGGARRPGWR